MTNRPTFRKGSTLIQLWIFLLLSAAVFGWGLRYKLSLYETSGARSLHMPVAKLLTQRERSAIAVVADGDGRDGSGRAREHTLPAWAVALSLALLVSPMGRLQTRQQATAPRRYTLRPCVCLFFRPPPALRLTALAI